VRSLQFVGKEGSGELRFEGQLRTSRTLGTFRRPSRISPLAPAVRKRTLSEQHAAPLKKSKETRGLGCGELAWSIDLQG